MKGYNTEGDSLGTQDRVRLVGSHCSSSTVAKMDPIGGNEDDWLGEAIRQSDYDVG